MKLAAAMRSCSTMVSALQRSSRSTEMGAGMNVCALRFPLIGAGLLLMTCGNLVGQSTLLSSNYRLDEPLPSLSIGLAKEITPFSVGLESSVSAARLALRSSYGGAVQLVEEPQIVVPEPNKRQSSDSLAPSQSRDLALRVQAVSIANETIGTGLLPEPSRPSWPDDPSDWAQIGRGEIYTNVQWRASLIQHHPLYFEDAMLERHGHTRCWRGWECSQSLVSGAKFFGTIAMMPYLKTLQPKHECVYAFGHYRAGSGAPCLRSNLPYDKHAAIVESASAAAFFWATPL